MRILPILLLLAGLALGAPSVRWIDAKGDARTEPIAEVLSESNREVRVRLENGKEFTVPLFRVVRLVRERDEDADEQALLRARCDVAAGARLAEACATLDRIATGTGKDWMREYALAARAEAAVRRGEEGAEQRCEAFLEQHADSRFFGAVVRALARGRALRQTDEEEAFRHLIEAEKRIAESGGRLLDRMATFQDGGVWVRAHNPEMMEMFLGGVESRLRQEAEGLDDLAHLVAVDACMTWIAVADAETTAREIAATGGKPFGQRTDVRRAANRSYVLAEARADAFRLLAALQQACGEVEDARASLARAAEIAPDSWRREEARRLAGLLEKGARLLDLPPE